MEENERGDRIRMEDKKTRNASINLANNSCNRHSV